MVQLMIRWSISDAARYILSDPRVVTRFEYISEDQIDAYFYASDMLVLPHRGFYAGSSGLLYEAEALGLPVIVSDVFETGHVARERNLGDCCATRRPCCSSRGPDWNSLSSWIRHRR